MITNPNKTPLKDMDDADIAAIVRAWPNVEVMGDEGDWVLVNAEWDNMAQYGVYRSEPATPDSINWSHVAPEFICMARDADGKAHLYIEKPDWWADSAEWGTGGVTCAQVSQPSYKRGTTPPEDSLVWRPGHGPEGE